MEDADEKALYGSWSPNNPHRPGMFRWWRRLMRDLDFALEWGVFREDWKALKVMGPLRLLYAKTLYRPHMRWLHRRNRHVMRDWGPRENGVQHRRCDWCGHFEPQSADIQKVIP